MDLEISKTLIPLYTLEMRQIKIEMSIFHLVHIFIFKKIKKTKINSFNTSAVLFFGAGL